MFRVRESGILFFFCFLFAFELLFSPPPFEYLIFVLVRRTEFLNSKIWGYNT